MPNRYSEEEVKDHPTCPGAGKQLVVVEVGRDFLGPRKKVFIFDPNGAGKSGQYEDDFYWLGTIRGLNFLGGIDEEEGIHGTGHQDLLNKIKEKFNLS